MLSNIPFVSSDGPLAIPPVCSPFKDFLGYQRARDEARSRKVDFRVFEDRSNAGVCMPEPPKCGGPDPTDSPGLSRRAIKSRQALVCISAFGSCPYSTVTNSALCLPGTALGMDVAHAVGSGKLFCVEVVATVNDSACHVVRRCSGRDHLLMLGSLDERVTRHGL